MARWHIRFDSNKLMALWIFLGLFLLYKCLHPAIDGDGVDRFNDLLALINGQSPTSKFSTIHAIISFPLYWVGAFFEKAKLTTAWFNPLIFCLLLLFLVRAMPTRTMQFFVAIFMLATSMFPNHIMTYYGETLTASAITLGIIALLKERLFLAVVLLSIGVVQTPATLPALVLSLIFLALKLRKPLYLFIILMPASAIIFENYVKSGAIFASPYLVADQGTVTILPYSGKAGFSYPFVLGFISILFSFGKGLLFFIPAIFLRFFIKPHTSADQKLFLLIDALLVFVFGMILIYANWWSWYGGFFWGPRFFLLACIPASLLLAYGVCLAELSFKTRLVLLSTILWSFWVCIQGFLFSVRDLASCLENNAALQFLCWYTPEFSPLFRQWIVGFPNIHYHQTLYILWGVISVLFSIWWLFFIPKKTNEMVLRSS
ncbi:hypothetical protein LZG75_00325 [Polynucleobacter sp. IMCC30063]|nr:hypothetical protein [Polynucleobacter sp. IMCC30063]